MSLEAGKPGRTARPGQRVGIGLLLFAALSAGFLFLNRDDSHRAAPEWKPGPFDPPVQYAFIPENSDCHGRLPPTSATCSEWQLHVNYRTGEGRQELDILYGASCGGHDGGCSTDVPLSDAVSQARVNDAGRRNGIPLRITADGHHLAYFSKQRMRFVGWDLPAAQLKAISPRLDFKALGDLSNLRISPDGRFFAVAFSGARPRLLLTEFATGRTSAFPGFCDVLGLSENAAVIAAARNCPKPGGDSATDTVTMLDRRGRVTGEWSGGGFDGDLSPDGDVLVTTHATIGEDGDEHLIAYDTGTGKTMRTLKLRLLSEPSDARGHGWLDADEYIVEAEPPEPGGSFGYYQVNVRTGKSQRIRDLGLDLGDRISLGDVRIGS